MTEDDDGGEATLGRRVRAKDLGLLRGNWGARGGGGRVRSVTAPGKRALLEQGANWDERFSTR